MNKEHVKEMLDSVLTDIKNLAEDLKINYSRNRKLVRMMVEHMIKRNREKIRKRTA